MIADGCFCNLILKVCTIRQFKKINDKCQTEHISDDDLDYSRNIRKNYYSYSVWHLSFII